MKIFAGHFFVQMIGAIKRNNKKPRPDAWAFRSVSTFDFFSLLFSLPILIVFFAVFLNAVFFCAMGKLRCGVRSFNQSSKSRAKSAEASSTEILKMIDAGVTRDEF